MVRMASERRNGSKARFDGRRQDHVGYRLYCGKHIVFRRCDWIRNGMRPVRGEGDAEMIETLALGLVTVALLVYLVYALLRPEKF
jgi:K+-transporting ATPase KdpF subunit